MACITSSCLCDAAASGHSICPGRAERVQESACWGQVAGNAGAVALEIEPHQHWPCVFVFTAVVPVCRDQLEKGETHDDLWNAAQKQMTQHGKMHGFLRMYWAKKVNSGVLGLVQVSDFRFQGWGNPHK